MSLLYLQRRSSEYDSNVTSVKTESRQGSILNQQWCHFLHDRKSTRFGHWTNIDVISRDKIIVAVCSFCCNDSFLKFGNWEWNRDNWRKSTSKSVVTCWSLTSAGLGTRNYYLRPEWSETWKAWSREWVLIRSIPSGLCVSVLIQVK